MRINMNSLRITKSKTSPLKYKTLQKELLATKISFGFRLLISFDKLNLRSDCTIHDGNMRVSHVFGTQSSESFDDHITQRLNVGKYSYYDSTKLYDIIRDTYDIKTFMETLPNSYDKNIKKRMKKELKIIRHNAVNFTIDDNNVSTFYNTKHFDIGYLNNRQANKPEPSDNIDDIINKLSDGSGLSYGFSKYIKIYNLIDKKLFFRNKISFIVDQPDMTNQEIKDLFTKTIDIVKEEYKNIDITVHGVILDYAKVESNENAVFFNDNKEYFHKFLNYVKQNKLEVVDKCYSDKLYNLHGKLVLPYKDTVNSDEVKRKMESLYNIFENKKFSKSMKLHHAKETIDDVIVARRSRSILSNQHIYFNLGTDDIRNIKKAYLKVNRNNEKYIDYKVKVPLSVFVSDLENIKKFFDEEMS